MSHREKPRTYQGEIVQGDMPRGLLAVSADRRGTFEPTGAQKAKAWVEAEAHIARYPEDAALILAATERFFGPRVEVDF